MRPAVTGRSRVLTWSLIFTPFSFSGVGANRVGGAAVVRQIPVLVAVKPEGDAAIGRSDRLQHHHHQVVTLDVRAACEIEIGGQSPARAKDHLAQHRAALEGDMRHDPFSVKSCSR